ncbi:heterokaryon incompatibility protein-domain-containing protein, partial [Podospora aff. communis PSN243]
MVRFYLAGTAQSSSTDRPRRFHAPVEGNCQNLLAAIDSCINSHGFCPSSKVTTSPLRLLNVMDGDTIKLERTNGEEHIYAALSYCWGGTESIEATKTTKANLDERTSGFFLHHLPPTLRDAVAVTRSFGVRYLWIDALCIVQNCRKEWAAEAQKMMRYYSNALFTIVPVHSESADSGMRLGQDVPFARRLPGSWSVDSGADLVLSATQKGTHRPDTIIDDSAWNKRGWTYQEKLNSARILFLFNHHLRLECREGSWDALSGWEARSPDSWRFIPMASPGSQAKTAPNAREDLRWRDNDSSWASLVDLYTQRQLTNRGDKWFAFSGISDA